MASEPVRQMPTFGPKSAFWRELRAASNEHLNAEAARGRPRTGDPRLARKTVLILGWFFLSYVALLLAPNLPPESSLPHLAPLPRSCIAGTERTWPGSGF